MDKIMKYISVNGQSAPVSFRQALLQGIASDGGLFIPESMPQLMPDFTDLSWHDLATSLASLFIDDIPQEDLRTIVTQALDFPIPLIKLEDRIYLLELFHGPTLAFKDIGARFMAQVLSHYLQQQNEHVTILVATSGDTGSAVAHAFHNVPNTSVFVLYPSRKISHLQEQQMTTLGGNIHAIEVDGTFDHCQRLVKLALNDKDITANHLLTTANSINIARLVPQIFYYVWALVQWQQLHKTELPTMVVPSGNFGNLTAAIYAKHMGAPIAHFIAATNANDAVPNYLLTGNFTPRPSIPTLSNAMDVGNASNFDRLLALYQHNVQLMRNEVTGMAISDLKTIAEMVKSYGKNHYILDPHTAVGVAAAKQVLRFASNSNMIVTATAHPAKFPEVIKRALNVDIPLPPALTEALARPKQNIKIKADYAVLKEMILGK